MKLVVVIPALDEAETLPRVLADLPAEMPRLAEMETIVVDDGSGDSTATIAFEHGATQDRAVLASGAGWPRPSEPGSTQRFARGPT